jgi:hypothetical protein
MLLMTPEMAAFPEILAGRLLHWAFRGLLSVHSRYGLRIRQVTYMTLYTRGFSRFVTSTTAPVATGWSNSCRVGSRPRRDRAFFQAHKVISPRLHHLAALWQVLSMIVDSPYLFGVGPRSTAWTS